MAVPSRIQVQVYSAASTSASLAVSTPPTSAVPTMVGVLSAREALPMVNLAVAVPV